MESNVLLIIFGMAIVTFLPRMLPLVLLNTEKIPPLIQGVLKNVPYAILGTLIFPGIFTINENLWYGAIGAVVAFAVSFIGANLIVVVLSAILVLTAISYFF